MSLRSERDAESDVERNAARDVQNNPQGVEFFVAGGTLRLDSPSYVQRRADEELFRRALAGEFCYILTSRQMGKSSLMIRTARRLQDEGVHAAIIDLTQLGSLSVAQEQWYLGLLTQLKRRLRFAADPVAWWQARSALGCVQRFTDFLREVLLEQVSGRVVIFIDEIDTTLKLDFRDDFFAAIRALHNARAEDAIWSRLSFVLLGVASPSDLIKDRTRTPFNIGQEIHLSRFSRRDASLLARGLEQAYPGSGAAIFERVFYWTQGHPYLTQKLCHELVEKASPACSHAEVDALVQELFLAKEARRETNLQFVRDSVLSHPQKQALLKLYARIQRGGAVRDNQQSALQNQLKLSGLAVEEGGFLQVGNRIYQAVFNQAWVRQNTPVNWVAWLAAVASAATLLSVGLLLYSVIVDAQATYAENCILYPRQEQKRFACLATLFRLRPLLAPETYADRGREWFDGLPAEQKLALFAADSLHSSPEDVILVVKELYDTLADVEQNGSSDQLLDAMRAALPDADGQKEASTLRQEMDSWRQARFALRQGQYEEARVAYDKALQLNPDNPAIWYEQAVVLTWMKDYPNALAALDKAIAIAKKSGAAMPTATPVSDVTPSAAPDSPATQASAAETTLAAPSPAAPGEAAQTAASTPAEILLIISPSPFPSLTPTAAPDLSGNPRVVTLAKMLGAAAALINSEQGLFNALIIAPAGEYSDLRQSFPYPQGGAMALIPAGAFQMGGNADAALQECQQLCPTCGCERGIFTDEEPIHTVTLDAFYMDVYEVTNARYQECVQAGACSAPSESKSYTRDSYYGSSQFADYPVILVSWDDAKTYCEWRGARLPTEAEWEKAARGGVEGKLYPWGDVFDGSRVNFCDKNCSFDWANQDFDDGYADTSPVGTYAPNAYGLYDMAGNVYEWVADWYAADYYAGSPADNPKGPASGEYRALRGGSWLNSGNLVRASSRYWYDPANRNDLIGFRCAFSP